MLFTAFHGMVFPNADPLQARHQGALLCQEWPGPLANGGKPISDKFYASADDIAADAKVKRMIAFFFACYGAGSPRLDDVSHAAGVQSEIAPHDLISALPRRLLGFPGGGALAVVGHIDRA